ncbi:MAG TPA: hypothetical protein VE685_05770 [Thermoanaerobaculia bacterium]|nr:hypothetical protein [Thermoanaerobaculia bacterium]
MIGHEPTVEDDHPWRTVSGRGDLGDQPKIRGQEGEVELISRRKVRLANVPVVEDLIETRLREPDSEQDNGLLVELVQDGDRAQVTPLSKGRDHARAVGTPLQRPELDIDHKGNAWNALSAQSTTLPILSCPPVDSPDGEEDVLPDGSASPADLTEAVPEFGQPALSAKRTTSDRPSWLTN